MPLNESQKKEIEKIFLGFNQDNTGALSFDEFYKFLEFAWRTPSFLKSMWSFDLNESIAKFIFDAISNECSQSVIFPEVLDLIEGILDKNQDYLIRFIYNAMDPKRSDNVPITTIPQAASLFGFDDCEKKINEKIVNLFGENKKNLAYKEFYQLITSKPLEKNSIPPQITPESDQNKTVSKSSCCLLI